VEVLTELLKCREGFDQLRRKVLRVRRRKTNAFKTGNGVHAAQQLGKMNLSRRSFAVGVDILSQQHDFLNPVADERFNFGNNLLARATDFPSTDVRNNTKTADLIASLHDGDERFRTLHVASRLGIFHVRWITIKIDLHRPALQSLDPLDHFRKFVDIMRAENQVKMRHAFQQALTFLLRNAASDTDDHSFPLFF
jgi:hypothetical protein